MNRKTNAYRTRGLGATAHQAVAARLSGQSATTNHERENVRHVIRITGSMALMTGTLRTISFAPELGQSGQATGGFSWRAAILTMLLALLLSTAAQARPNPVTVRVSPEVEKAIKAADPKTAARMKKAIQVGNKFVRLRFNNDDGYDPEIEDEWNNTVGPLIAMSGEQWFQWRDQRLPSVLPPIHLGDGYKKMTSLMACPALTLSEIKNGNSGYFLIYRTVLVGGYIEKYPDTPGRGGHKEWIDKAQSGHQFHITIEIGTNNRITSESSSEKSLVFHYFYYLNQLSRSAVRAETQGSPSDAKSIRALLADIGSAASVCK